MIIIFIVSFTVGSQRWLMNKPSLRPAVCGKSRRETTSCHKTNIKRSPGQGKGLGGGEGELVGGSKALGRRKKETQRQHIFHSAQQNELNASLNL